jgi:hypothetical protein
MMSTVMNNMLYERIMEDLVAALQAAKDHLNYIRWGDSWERECAKAQGLEEIINKALESASRLPDGWARHHDTIAVCSQAAILAATERAVKAEKDTTRINWLGEALFSSRWNGVIDSGSRVDWTIAPDWRHVTTHMKGDSFREAIDAAIDQHLGEKK